MLLDKDKIINGYNLLRRMLLELGINKIKKWAKRGSGTSPKRWVFLTSGQYVSARDFP
jgi:hypothetical protein